MKRIAFGISQLKARTPDAVKWLRSGSAKVALLIVIVRQFYPQYISAEFVTEVSTFSLMVAAIAPYFGVKPLENEELPK